MGSGETITKEVVKTVEVPGETVVVENEVVKTVEVPSQTVTVEVVKEVQVPGETVVVEKEVVKTVEVPGQTVVVEKEVIKTIEVPEIAEEDKYGGTLRWTPESALNSQRLFVSGVYIKGGFIDVVYDKLLAWDQSAVSQPQMLDSWIVEDNRRFLFKLRDGLLFHDGHPVDSADVVASLERWMVGDPIGRLNKLTLEKMEALDDRTIESNSVSLTGRSYTISGQAA